MDEKIVISSPADLKLKKKKMRAGRAESLHIVSDFDATLTKYFVNGRKIPSLMAFIREYNYLSPEFSKGSFALLDKYHPFERDETISLEDRCSMMTAWRNEHVALMQDHGLNKTVLKKLISEQALHSRDGFEDFLKTARDAKIPLLIFSAGIADLIEGFLEKENLFFPNIHIVSNHFSFDEKGTVAGYDSAVIHSLNKDELLIRRTPYFEEIKKRRNVILLGDGIADLKMIRGMEHDVVLSIGFLNDNAEENLELFKDHFDVIILNDGGMIGVNKILKEIVF
jgi:5'-nucleotidase